MVYRKEIVCTETKHYTVVIDDNGRFDRLVAYSPIYHTVGLIEDTIIRDDVVDSEYYCYNYPAMGDFWGVDNNAMLRFYRKLLRRCFGDIKRYAPDEYRNFFDMFRVKDKAIFDIIKDC